MTFQTSELPDFKLTDDRFFHLIPAAERSKKWESGGIPADIFVFLALVPRDVPLGDPVGTPPSLCENRFPQVCFTEIKVAPLIWFYKNSLTSCWRTKPGLWGAAGSDLSIASQDLVPEIHDWKWRGRRGRANAKENKERNLEK